MSAPASTDCYLCGARNDYEADFCVRCDGQLLKIPVEPVDLATSEATEFIDDAIPDVEEDVIQKPKRRRARSGSVEDQRLSDALGLTEDEDDVDPEFIDTVVTSIPRATQSASIPLIGTRTGVVSQASMHTKEFGVRTYVLLGLLLIATAWLGWSTLSDSGAVSPTPDNLAFTNSTLPMATTTTTEVARRQWSEAEVSGKYAPAFARVQLYDCPAETPEGQLINVQPDDDLWTSGIAIDEHNVLINSADLRTANVAIVRGRNGAQHLAILSPGKSGTRVATTVSTMVRNLDLDETSEGSPTYYLTYDRETNVVESLPQPADMPIEATVSDVGDLLEVRIGATRYNSDELRQLNSVVEPIDDEDAPIPATLCDRASQLEYITNELTAEQAGTN